MSDSKAIICAGFHRSGTSLVASTLASTGLPYAIDPLLGNISNPKGHFEDLVAIKMHDRLLDRDGASWMYAGEQPLRDDSTVRIAVANYIKRRDQLHPSGWLLKDPRTTLYLDAWNDQLRARGYFILIYRHWKDCIHSIFKRHSRNIAHSLPCDKALHRNIVFWQEPEKAANMWIAYNHKLLSFYEKHRKKSLFVSQHDILNGLDITREIEDKFKLVLPEPSLNVINNRFTESVGEADWVGLLSNEKVNELESLFRYMENFGKVEESIGINQPKFIGMGDSEHADSETGTHYKASVALSDMYDYFLHSIKFETIESQDLFLKKSRPLSSSFVAKKALKVAKNMEVQAPLNWIPHRWLGVLYHHLSDYTNALKHLKISLKSKNSPPFIHELLAKTYLETGCYSDAEKHFKMAIVRNPKNAKFNLSLARFYKVLSRFDEALEELESVLSKTAGKLGVGDYIECVELHSGLTAAFEEIERLRNKGFNNSVLDEQRVRLLLCMDYEQGLDSYQNSIAKILKNENLSEYLRSTQTQIKADKARNIFRNYVCKHWCEVLGSEVDDIVRPRNISQPTLIDEQKIDFIVVGAQKAGTSALHLMLDAHPDISMSAKKELHFFDNDSLFERGVVDYSEYHKMFAPAKPGLVRGESTPIYSYWRPCLERIHAYNSSIKLIFVMRDPLERAYSHWNMEYNRGDEKLDFESSIRAELACLEKFSNYQHRVRSYLSRGNYLSQIEIMWRLFDKKQLSFINYSEYLDKPYETLNKLCSFLGVGCFDKETFKLFRAHVGAYKEKYPNLSSDLTDVLDGKFKKWYDIFGSKS